MVKKFIGLFLLLTMIALVPACSDRQDFEGKLGKIVAPYEFNQLRWEYDSLSREAANSLTGVYKDETDSAKVVQYLAGVRKSADLQPMLAAVRNGDRPGDAGILNSELTALKNNSGSEVGPVEAILSKQIREVLNKQGIVNPFINGLKVGFPPVTMRIEDPIHLLVISQRNKIGTVKQVILRSDLSIEDMDSIESQVDALGYSSLVVELGGTAVTYPAFVSNRGDVRYTIEAAAEEWTHQYLAFKPLGFLYALNLLNIRHDADIPAMNETVAGMVSREIGAMVYKEYYQQAEDMATARRPSRPAPGAFSFNAEMRQIRLQVDSLLAAGNVDDAEAFMKEKRQFLATQNYYLRKINQAYFSFYGNYVTAPGSITPVGNEFDKLREQSGSLAEFLNKAASLTDHKQLEDLIK